MRVLVTGAQGCIGTWIVKQLLDRGVDVLVYDLDANPARLSAIAPTQQVARLAIESGNIEDSARIKTLVKDGGITHIVHLAAVLMPFCQANPVAGGIINVIGTLNVFEAARDAGRPVRVVYASSSAVWGPEEAYEPRTLSEKDPLKPATHYGVFKQANEGNAHGFFLSNGISSIGLRPWAVYGFGRDHGLTADPTLAIKALVTEKPFTIRISGFMDLQYVEDVADIFIRCMESNLEGSHAFNLAGRVIRMEDYRELLERLHPGAARLISVAGQKVQVAYRMDDSQLRVAIPGIPTTPLEVGVQKTLEIYQRLRMAGAAI